MDQDQIILEKVISRIKDWEGKEYQLEKVPGGITNLNWKLTVDGIDYFVKIPGKGTESFINRSNAHIANVIAAEEDIGPKVCYYFEDSRVEIFEWLNNYRTLNFGDVFHKKIFYKIIETIKKFHNHNRHVLPVTKNPFDQTYEMMGLAKKLNCYLPPEIERMEWLVNRIEEAILTVGIRFVPCHVDHWTANYLYNDETGDLKLIDFEYASMNDVGWDFAGISTTNYFTEAMDVEWIKGYFGGLNEIEFAKFKLYKILTDINWTLWSSVQINQSSVKDFDYYMWFGTKISRLRQNWIDPRLDYWLNLVKGVPIFIDE